jgi:hypothetical protein
MSESGFFESLNTTALSLYAISTFAKTLPDLLEIYRQRSTSNFTHTVQIWAKSLHNWQSYNGLKFQILKIFKF